MIILFSSCLLAQKSEENGDSLRYAAFKNYQVKVGYSTNKGITNVEGNYSFALSQAFAFGVDVRLLSFPSISPSLVTMPIILTNKFSISIKGGLEFFAFSPFTPFLNVSTHYGGIIRYEINDDYNIIVEFKQINQNTTMDGFDSFLPRKHVRGFPIQFISSFRISFFANLTSKQKEIFLHFSLLHRGQNRNLASGGAAVLLLENLGNQGTNTYNN